MEYIARYDKNNRTLFVSIKTTKKKKIAGVLNSLKGKNIANVENIKPQNLSFEIRNCPDANWKEGTDGTGVFDDAKSAMDSVQNHFIANNCKPDHSLAMTARALSKPPLSTTWKQFSFGQWN